jgi:multidrug efflux pump subunit AcrB
MKDFKPTSWAIDNRTSIFIVTIIITLAGILSYRSLPKEQFPDVVIPTIFVSTLYPGASPTDMEQLVTRPIEKQLKGVSGVKNISSSSVQDYSIVIVEFDTDLDVVECKNKVKDAVDKAKRDLPNDLPRDPSVAELDISEIPIMSVNLYGDLSLDKIKTYAEKLQDRIEALPEITRVDIVGALDKEVQIEVDKYKMAAAQLTFRDIENAIASENMTVSAGNVDVGGMTRSVSIRGDFQDVEQIRNIIINSQSGARLYLKDVADVRMGYAKQESYSRLNGKNVITLNVIKRVGENLINASDQIQAIVREMKANEFPESLNVIVTGDQSRSTRVTLQDLINSIIIGFILVTVILMFFMGGANAIFVALSVPLSMFLAFMVLPAVGFTMNMIVLFAFLLGLGIVVDDAIVVIENTHRIYHEEKLGIVEAAKRAAAEVFWPVLSGTATTLAPFFPLVFWGGIFGKFMHYLPVTIIITLTASLLVAYIINPVFAVWFMRREDDHTVAVDPKKARRRAVAGYVLYGLALVYFYANQNWFMGNLLVVVGLIVALYRYVLYGVIERFQRQGWPSVQRAYTRFLRFALERPWTMLSAVLLLFLVSCGITASRQANIVLFPKADPNFIYVYLTLPEGTDVEVTDSLTQILERKVVEVVGPDNPIVESVIANVALNASEDRFDRTATSNKGKVGIAFVEYAKRNGVSTRQYLDKIRQATRGLFPGANIVVDQEQAGPPTPKPISIEIKGDNLNQLVQVSTYVKRYLDSLDIPGVEELRSDLVVSKPEISIQIDRERANREGISTAQIGGEFRTAILGREASKFRDGEDEIPINIRLREEQRTNINAVENLNITFRDMNMGGVLRSIPMSALAEVKYQNTFAGVRRLDLQRTVTLSSNIEAEYQPKQTQVVNAIKAALRNLPSFEGVTIGFKGEDEEVQKAASFLGRSLLISVLTILLILVTQFNSFGKTLIILTEVVFSVIGVLLGIAIFNMDFSVIMMGVGIVALAGIVVKNGILLVEFTDLMRSRGLGVREAVIEAGRARMAPVLLTAISTVLGLIPLAIGFNIDFESLLSTGDPKIFFGGDSVAFWGPLSWTIIFGLTFATFITLIILPVMYLKGWQIKQWWNKMVA